MATTTSNLSVVAPDQAIELFEIAWEQYVTISDALVDRHQPRMIYLDGRLTLLTTSRGHDWIAERMADLVKIAAGRLGFLWEDAGQATFRRADMKAGVEGDKTFYFGEHAEIMKGSRNIDLKTQPPPDLAIEVEVSHPANLAVSSWGRLGVPEIWRFKAETWTASFWARQPDGTYNSIDRSLAIPVLTPSDVSDQVQAADSLGASAWFLPLHEWVRDVLAPRLAEPR